MWPMSSAERAVNNRGNVLVTRCVPVAIVAGEKQCVLHIVKAWCVCVCVCVCSLTYRACNAHAPYCQVVCPALQYFFTSSKKTERFSNIYIYMKCVFCFSLQLLSVTFLILKGTERDIIKNVYRSAYKVSAILVRFQ